jgi:hypothetical protein
MRVHGLRCASKPGSLARKKFLDSGNLSVWLCFTEREGGIMPPLLSNIGSSALHHMIRHPDGDCENRQRPNLTAGSSLVFKTYINGRYS